MNKGDWRYSGAQLPKPGQPIATEKLQHKLSYQNLTCALLPQSSGKF